MDITSFIKVLEQTIEGLPPGTLQADTVLTSLPQWDSLAILTFLAQVDVEYNVQISGAEIQQSKTVADLFKVVSGKVATKG